MYHLRCVWKTPIQKSNTQICVRVLLAVLNWLGYGSSFLSQTLCLLELLTNKQSQWYSNRTWSFVCHSDENIRNTWWLQACNMHATCFLYSCSRRVAPTFLTDRFSSIGYINQRNVSSVPLPQGHDWNLECALWDVMILASVGFYISHWVFDSCERKGTICTFNHRLAQPENTEHNHIDCHYQNHHFIHFHFKFYLSDIYNSCDLQLEHAIFRRWEFWMFQVIMYLSKSYN